MRIRHWSLLFQVLYEYVFCNSEITSSFGIFTGHPRSFVSLDTAVAEVEGMLVVEEDEELIDPLSLGSQVNS